MGFMDLLRGVGKEGPGWMDSKDSPAGANEGPDARQGSMF